MCICIMEENSSHVNMHLKIVCNSLSIVTYGVVAKLFRFLLFICQQVFGVKSVKFLCVWFKIYAPMQVKTAHMLFEVFIYKKWQIDPSKICHRISRHYQQFKAADLGLWLCDKMTSDETMLQNCSPRGSYNPMR